MSADKLISAVRSWIGTPYHHHARVKHVGVDCGQLVCAAHEEAGLVDHIETGEYTCDWHLHRFEDKYIQFVEAHLARVDDNDMSVDASIVENSGYEAPSASVIVFRVGRTFSHGGIITTWPFFVHAYLPSGIVEEVDIRNTPMSARSMRVYMHKDLIR